MRSLRSAIAAAIVLVMPAGAWALSPTPTPGPVLVTPGPGGVSASTHDGNVPANTVDNNLGTRWSAGSEGAWLQFDLGSSARVSYLQIAVYRGNERRNRFDLISSVDGATWTTVILNAQSNGTTTQQETYDFPDVTARYIRYVGKGHVTNAGVSSSMNSVTEVDIWGGSNQPTTPPGPPSGVRAFPAEGMVTLRWGHTLPIGHYRVYRRLSGCTTLDFVGTAQPSHDYTVTFLDQNVTDGRHYYYAVSSVNSAGEGAKSAEIAVTPQLQPPPAPQLSATAGPVDSGRVDLSWFAVPTAERYLVERAPRPPCWPMGFPSFTGVATVNAPATAFTDTTAGPGQRYVYRLRATNAAGDGPGSNIVAVDPPTSATPDPRPSPTPCPTGTPTPMPPVVTATAPPPTNVQIEAGSGKVRLTWTTQGTYPNHTWSSSVYRSDVACGPFTQVARYIGSVNRHVDTGLANGTTYYYVVVGVNPYGESLDSEVVGETPAALPPRAPTGLSATPFTSETTAGIRLMWTEVFADTYSVKRSETQGGPYTTLVTGLPSQSQTLRSYEDVTGELGRTYYYVVTASNSSGESQPSNEASAAFPGSVGAPTNLRAMPFPNTISLSWLGVGSATGYRVKRATGPCGSYTTIATIGPSSTTYSDAVSAMRFYYVVTALNGSAESGNSNVAAAAPIYQVGAPPPTLTATANADGTVRLTWNVNGTYRIYRRLNHGPSCAATPYRILDIASGPTYTDAAVTPGTIYEYQTRLLLNGLLETDSSYARVTTAGTRPGPTPTPPPCATSTPTPIPPATTAVPGQPFGLAAAPAHQRIGFTWSAASQPWRGYNLYAATDACGPYRPVARLLEPYGAPAPLEHLDTGMINGATRHYLLSAENSLGEGPDSNVVATASVAGPPPAPAFPSGVAAPGTILINWPPAYTATSHEVLRGTSLSGPFTAVGTSTTDGFLDTSVVAGTTYYYKVAARNAHGQGAPSAAGFGIVAVGGGSDVPTGLVASSTGDGIDLRWNPVTGASYYRIYRGIEGNPSPAIRIYSGLSLTTHRDRWGIFPSGRYSYTVSAVKNGVEGGRSAPAVANAPLGGFVEITPPPSAVIASSSDGTNVPPNVVDNDLLTRWSGNGDGTWIQFDLSSTKTLSFISVAVYGGTTRRNVFDLQVSGNGTIWTTVLARAQSSGTTTHEEVFDFPDVSTRFVRYLGHGSNVSTWNSLSEISLFGPVCTPAPPPPPTPPAPTALRATPGDGRITLDWTINSGSTSHGYRVYRSTSSGGGYVSIATVSLSTPTYTDTTVTNGTTYYYVVREYKMYMTGFQPPCPHHDEIIESPNSNEASATPAGGSVTPTPTATPTPTPTPTGTPVNVTPGGSAVTGSTHDGNLPANTVDNNLATRWSGNGNGAWIQYDLGATRTVTHLSIGVYRGNERANLFDVLVSLDGTDWMPVATARQTTGTTTNQETHDVDDRPARYVRYIGHGSTANTWNSVTEVDIFAVP